MLGTTLASARLHQSQRFALRGTARTAKVHLRALSCSATPHRVAECAPLGPHIDGMCLGHQAALLRRPQLPSLCTNHRFPGERVAALPTQQRREAEGEAGRREAARGLC